ncbi:MAG: hypothetical protein V1921_09125 [Candidatus Altiarchaeota archaeon]
MVGKRGNPSPKLPESHGVPAAETLWLPPHYSKEVRDKGGLEKAVIWSVEDVVDFIFPKKYQPKYFEVATKFLKIVLERDWVTKKDISRFLKENGYSRSTLENKIIPKLVRFGLIKREREITAGMGKGRSLILSDSMTFTNYLERIAFGWNMLVSTARQKKVKGQSAT